MLHSREVEAKVETMWRAQPREEEILILLAGGEAKSIFPDGTRSVCQQPAAILPSNLKEGS